MIVKRKYLFALIPLLLLTVVITISTVLASAAGEVVFVNQSSGSDSADGASASTALKTLDAAIKKLTNSGGTIVLSSDYTLSTHYETPDYAGKITVTSKHNGTEYGGKLRITGECLLRLHGDTTFRDLTVYQTKALTFVANFNPITFDDGFAVQSTGSKNVSVVGGYWEPTDSTLKNNLDSHITVNSGDFNYLLGFTRKKGSATQEYKGTSYITFNGGTTQKIYGGTSENHYGGNTVITVNGGSVTTLYTGGDATRRLRGDATVVLNGGTVKTLEINNVCGDIDLSLIGAAPSSLSITYKSDAIKEEAEKSGTVKTVTYNSLACPQTIIDKFAGMFDIINNETVVFAAGGGKGNGTALDKPLGSLNDACELIKANGGKILVVSGELEYDIVKSDTAYGGPIEVVGHGEDAVIALGSGQKAIVNSDMSFDNIKLKAYGDSAIYGCFHDLKIGSKVTTEGNISVYGSDIGSANKDVYLEVQGGSYVTVAGIAPTCTSYTGDVTVIVGANTKKATLSQATDSHIGTATLSVCGGEHENVIVSEGGDVTGDTIVNLLGTKVNNTLINGAKNKVILNVAHVELAQAVRHEGLTANKAEKILALGPKADESKLADIKASFSDDIIRGNFVYVESGADGHGRSPDSPAGDLNTAIKLLGAEGTVVVSGILDIHAVTEIEEHDYAVTLTNIGVGVDYRGSGAAIRLGSKLFFGGEMKLEYLNFETEKSGTYLCAMAHKLTIGDEVDTELVGPDAEYINIVGGRDDNIFTKKVDLTINSGNWAMVRAGGSDYDLYESDVVINFTVNGGTFHRYIALASRGNNKNGTINFTVNGGIFYQSIYAVYEEDGRLHSPNFNVTVTLNDGKFYQMIAPACSYTTKLYGKYTVNLNGGDFSHLTDLLGTELYQGSMDSYINISQNVDINAKVVGTDTFTNPVRASGPDPWVFYYDGHYYYTHTTGRKIVLMKVSNFSDIDTSAERVIIEPTEGQNMWSPEIHHFTAEEVGEENAGWYLYIGYDDGTTANQRQHVLKCLDGDNLLGRWGDPVTGRLNQPRKVEVPNAPHYNNDELCGGSSKIVIGGKTYMTFVSEVGRGTSDFHQTINITEIENPWTYKSVPTTICVPEYSWEMGGYGGSGTTWWPKVVEGASAVYSDNGDVYLMYTGSGYWTIHYQLGYLKFLGGDPMDASNWKKNPKSILSYSDEVNGCGHGSYFKDHEGNYYVAYHGYLGKTAEGGRYAHIERIYVTSEGITIGNGTGHPAPLSSVYTISLNPTPLAEKISGFVEKDDSSDRPDWFDKDQNDTTDDTTPVTDPSGNGGGLDTTTAIIIVVAAVVVVGGAVAVFLVLDSKKKKK